MKILHEYKKYFIYFYFCVTIGKKKKNIYGTRVAIINITKRPRALTREYKMKAATKVITVMSNKDTLIEKDLGTLFMNASITALLIAVLLETIKTF